MIDHFWDSCKWIRYTYDFGDEWRHKIIYEKTDASYQGRSAVLIKAKGDNFCEDSGGVWNSQDNRTPFDPGKIKERLERRNIPERSGEILQIPESLSELTRQYFEQFLQKLDHVQKRKKAVSPMAKKSDAWRKHVQEQSMFFWNLYQASGQIKNFWKIFLIRKWKTIANIFRFSFSLPGEREDDSGNFHDIPKSSGIFTVCVF